MRSDGYIYATKLCHVGGKQMGHWLALNETKELVKKIQNKLDVENGTISESRYRKNETINDTEKSICEIRDRKEAIEIHKGGNKYQQGTWIHPDLGIHLAQWISSEFSLQVSKWVRELILTDEVRLGQEKSEKQIREHYESIIQELQNKVERSENTIISITNECKYLLQQYKTISNVHRSYLRRKELYRLREGPCVYLINMIGMSDDPQTTSKIKIGFSGDITTRVSGYRTSNPFCKLLYVAYTQEHVLIEKCMKTMYDKNLKPNNSEFITDVPFETIKKTLEDTMKMLNVENTVETDEELKKFNQHNITEDDIGEIDEIKPEDFDENSIKRCGGFLHKDEESRMLPRKDFFRNKSNRDGYNRICKNCYLTIQYGDDRKRKKVVDVPAFDATTHKWCNLCEMVKLHGDFYNDKMKSDGLNANCKACKARQKREYKAAHKDPTKKTFDEFVVRVNDIEHTISFRSDGFYNVSRLCSTFDKKFDSWVDNLKNGSAFNKELHVYKKLRGNKRHQGIFLQKDFYLDFCRWLSDDLYTQVSERFSSLSSDPTINSNS
jgi:hypothetical protein